MIGVDLKAPMHSDPIAAAIAGQAEADRIVAHVERDIAGQDALHVAAMRVREGYGAQGLAAFHARLQKQLGRLQRNSSKVLERQPAG